MSSLPVWCELVCDECAMNGFGRWTFGSIPRREMKREAINGGWSVGSKVLCDECSHASTEEDKRDDE